jgi:hypothetical protein
MEIFMHYVKPVVRPINSSPLMILSLLEGDVTPTSYNSLLEENIKKRKLKNKKIRNKIIK